MRQIGNKPNGVQNHRTLPNPINSQILFLPLVHIIFPRSSMQRLKQQILTRDHLLPQQLIHKFRLPRIRVANYCDSRHLRNLIISLTPQQFFLFQFPRNYFVQFYVLGLY